MDDRALSRRCTRPGMTEAQAEKLADRMVMNRLERSRAYRHAGTAEEQSRVEDTISDAVWLELSERYDIGWQL